MAIASTRTLLSLDRYAKIMGINPVLFNGGGSIELSDGSQLFPIDNDQMNIWPQFAWQANDQISREELAEQIRKSELEIIAMIGWNPTPDWDVFKANYNYLFRDSTTVISPTVQLNKTKFIAGGVRKSTVVVAGSIVGYTDEDNDGWEELATIQFAKPAGANIEELKIYYPGKEGDREYEIRDIKAKYISGANVVIKVPSWNLINYDILQAYPTNDVIAVDMSDATSFLITVDVYWERNDTTQNSAFIFYHDEITEAQQSAGGVILGDVTGRDRVLVKPGTYDTTLAEWVIDQCFDGYIDYVDLYYYSGAKEKQFVKNTDDYISTDIAKAIAYLATSRLDRIYYANNNSVALADNLMRDYLEPAESYNPAPYDLSQCPFGTKVGEYLAWKSIRNFVQRRPKFATI